MLTPNQLDKIPKEAVKIWQQLDEFITQDIARRIAKAGKATSTAEYQAIVAEFLGKGQLELKQEIAKILKISDQEVNRIFSQAINTSYKSELEEFAKAGVALNNQAYIDNLIMIGAERTNETFYNMTKTLGFGNSKTLTEAYINQMDLAYLKVSSGATDYNSAMNQAVKSLVSKGLRYVDYASGRSYHIDVAARRNIITSINQSSNLMSEKNVKDNGVEYVEISAHIGARPSHGEWQGKVMKYEDLPFRTGYGTASGLGGVNCRHSFHAFFKGISVKAPQEEESNVIINGKEYTPYEVSQKQRLYERKLRDLKRGNLAAKAIGDDVLASKYRAQASLVNKSYKNFSNQAGVRPKTERTTVVGYK